MIFLKQKLDFLTIHEYMYKYYIFVNSLSTLFR